MDFNAKNSEAAGIHRGERTITSMELELLESANLSRSLQKFDATFCQMMTRLVFRILFRFVCVSCLTTFNAPKAVF